MTGSGNDFVMVDSRYSDPAEWSVEDIRSVCARGTGIGADGVVFVGPDRHPGAIRMVYFNSDGSRAAMCGNAALCSTRLATWLGMTDTPRIRLETDSGPYEGRGGPTSNRAELLLGPVAAPTTPTVVLQPGEAKAAFARVGVPHLVISVAALGGVDLLSRGRTLRHEPILGPEGANVNFVAPLEPLRSVWGMRTYERGVEAETLACGTGAVAAACCLHAWGLGTFPVTLITQSGMPLVVRAQPDGAAFRDAWLEGEARLVFRGVLTA